MPKDVPTNWREPKPERVSYIPLFVAAAAFVAVMATFMAHLMSVQ